ncbi:MAG: hypothetical protein JNL98_32475 [Bryobacterales bacterium]|nr:hypothetical protein [Bryobacterales bacterium]
MFKNFHSPDERDYTAIVALSLLAIVGSPALLYISGPPVALHGLLAAGFSAAVLGLARTMWVMESRTLIQTREVARGRRHDR